MARSRRKVDIYSHPGLFDFEDTDKAAETDEWEPGRVLFNGGSVSDDVESDSILPPVLRHDDTYLRFMSFGSGSSGNSAYLGTDSYGVIIDAGVDPERIVMALARNGIGMENIIGILLTHDHSDHVSHAYKILRDHRHMGLFCTPKTLGGLLRRHGISRRIKEYHKPIYKETPFFIRDFRITAFEVSHDGSDNVGYIIEYRHHKFVVATDMGIIGDRAGNYMGLATALMVESDYDNRMLVTGRYPEYLKARILAERGHLDNDQVAQFLRSVWSGRLKNVFLCHLSKDNNTPEIALRTAREALLQAGASKVGDGSESLESRDAPVQLYALPRFEPSPLFFLR